MLTTYKSIVSEPAFEGFEPIPRVSGSAIRGQLEKPDAGPVIVEGNLNKWLACKA